MCTAKSVFKVPRYSKKPVSCAYCDCLLSLNTGNIRFGNLPGLPTAFATCNWIFAMSVTSRTTKERTKMVKTGGPWGKDAWPQSHSWVMMQLMTSHNDGVSTSRWPRPNWQQLPRGLVQSLSLILLHAPGRLWNPHGWILEGNDGKECKVETCETTFTIGETVWIMWETLKLQHLNKNKVCQIMHLSPNVKLRAYRMLMFSWFVCSEKTECSLVAAKWQQLNQQSPT